jgi:ribosomal-protein-alanine N-acetyltransferase
MIPLNFCIQTKRLKLRSRNIDDNKMIFSATRFKGFNDGMLWDPPVTEQELIPRVESAKQSWLKGDSYTFVITIESHSVGMISIRKTKVENTWNVGFFLHPDYQRKGYMTESTLAVLDFGFNKLRAKIIEAQCATWNVASEKVLISSGMKFKEIIPNGFKKNGSWVEEKKYQIMYDEFVQN